MTGMRIEELDGQLVGTGCAAARLDRNPGAWFLAGLLMITGALADFAMAAPFGLILNGIFASAGVVVAGEGLRSARSPRVASAFIAELCAAAGVLLLLVWPLLRF